MRLNQSMLKDGKNIKMNLLLLGALKNLTD